MPITPLQEFASNILRRIQDLDPSNSTALSIAQRETVYKIALGKNVSKLNYRFENLEAFVLPPRRRSKYKYDYDYVIKALIVSCYKKALNLPTCAKEDKMFLECMVDKNTIRPATHRAKPKNVIQFTAAKKTATPTIIEDFEHEQLICV